LAGFCRESQLITQVSNVEKIYSIFEPHTDLIKRGKLNTPLEFGHKVFLAENARGLITQYEVPNGNLSDEGHVEPSLKRHKQLLAAHLNYTVPIADFQRQERDGVRAQRR
jgi:hypothetical protein